MKRTIVLMCAAAMLMMIGGCGSGYVLKGKAISGEYGTLLFVQAGDEQLGEAGVPYAEITVYRDAGCPNQSLFTTGRSDFGGAISIPLDAFGAGWMDEMWLIEVIAPGFETLQLPVRLPSAKDDMRLLIILRPGRSLSPQKREDLWEEAGRYR